MSKFEMKENIEMIESVESFIKPAPAKKKDKGAIDFIGAEKKTESILLRVTPSFFTGVKEESELLGISMTSYITQIVERYMKDHGHR